MTIDEAIRHCEEVAERYDRVEDSHADDGLKQECIQCAADHRQLAEWLTDYKKSQEELAEAKRLLKLAICELGDAQDCDSCIADCSIGTDCIYKWHCSNEAEKLING